MIFLFKFIHTTNRINLFNYIHITNNHNMSASYDQITGLPTFYSYTPKSGVTCGVAKTDEPETLFREQFSDTISLISHSEFGKGPIRHIDNQGICFHGVNNHSDLDLKHALTGSGDSFSQRSDLTTDDFLHCHFASPSYVPGSKPRPYSHHQWDHNDPGFCTHCIRDTNLNKRRRLLTVYKCLGHKQ